MTNQTLTDLIGIGEDAPDVTRLVLGGPFGTEPLGESFARLDHFAEVGGRLVETAHSYKGGAAQAAIGSWNAEHPGALRVMTKIGHDPASKGDIPLDRALVLEHLDASIAALNVDAADIVLYHTDDPDRTVRELADTLLEIVSSGRARHVGASNWQPDRFAQLATLLAADGQTAIASYQYGLAAPAPERLRPGNLAADGDVLAMLEHAKSPLFAWSSQAGGYFSRTDGADTPTRSTIFESDENARRRERCRTLAANLGTEPGILALAWTLHRPATWAAIGPRTAEQLDGSVAALGLTLSDEDVRWLETGTAS